mmetsp:Transcript_6762/g.19227  ORF Transcript_6762/g.19227 Transcript_6762/m.19227 type:complete len:306 (-) Transcript_6762:323-1240(-)
MQRGVSTSVTRCPRARSAVANTCAPCAEHRLGIRPESAVHAKAFATKGKGRHEQRNPNQTMARDVRDVKLLRLQADRQVRPVASHEERAREERGREVLRRLVGGRRKGKRKRLRALTGLVQHGPHPRRRLGGRLRRLDLSGRPPRAALAAPRRVQLRLGHGLRRRGLHRPGLGLGLGLCLGRRGSRDRGGHAGRLLRLRLLQLLRPDVLLRRLLLRLALLLRHGGPAPTIPPRRGGELLRVLQVQVLELQVPVDTRRPHFLQRRHALLGLLLRDLLLLEHLGVQLHHDVVVVAGHAQMRVGDPQV